MERKELIGCYYDTLCNIRLKRVSDVLNDNLRGTYVILRTINNLGGNAVASDISKKLGISTSRVAVALNMLDQKGYIKKEHSNHDARKTNVTITEEGKDILSAWEGKICAEIDEILAKITDEEAEHLYNIMQKLIN